MSRNELADATSPYLLQHAGNPVHWRMWGPAALAEARREGKPILLSIGYAACHWCHVMAHESFEDAATAALMNRLYVNIKVDREERPDLDRLYMGALNAMGEQGGWPLTIFLTPDGAPFWGGTYFPPEPRWGRPSFRQVLTSVHAAWERQPEAIAANARSLTAMLETMGKARPGEAIDPAALERAGTYLAGLVDPDKGGLKGAPKFPSAPLFRFLWQEAFRRGDHHLAGLVARTLRRMCQGGIWDHLGGGLARYSTDATWLVPHFEKMLSDNAQLLDQLALVHAAAPDPLFAVRAEELVAWLEREMRADPGYAASQDADSEGEEGRFYVWTAAEIGAVLGPEAAPAFRAAYGVTDSGNWEGRTVLSRSPDLALKDPETEAALAAARARLFAVRAGRVHPATDDKVLADWNGLMVAALVRAAVVFARPAWRTRAAEVFHALDRTLRDGDDRLGHAWRAGRLSATGMLEDVAAMARAALALHEATGAEEFLARARALVDEAEARFADGAGAFFATAADATDVPVRSHHAADDVTPSGIGMMAEVLARLWHLTGETGFRDRARRLLAAFAGAGDALAAMPCLLAAADLLEGGAVVVVAGPAGDPGTEALLAAALAAPDPAVVVTRAGPGLGADHPAAGKGMVNGAPAAYLCRNGVCLPPVAEAGALRAALVREG